ncbi:DUF4198 domain-containing protein [Candidatus Uabimicrobium sp. HlEnr_7]|uniref:DUF4198 domain-containing protein n=1 Tax=Candidatus Uabimicrobium helgolandensis TaxID=3095367 RepID=UPI00355607D8
MIKCCLLFFLGLCTFLNAHTFWLQPSFYTPNLNDITKIKIFIGHVTEAEEYTRNPYHIKKFLLNHQQKSTPIVGIDGRSPAGFFRTAKEGCYTVTYESLTSLSSLPVERFQEYLKKEVLTDVDIPKKEIIHEYYLRCAKTLIQVGKEKKYHPCKVGMPLELVCKNNPYDLAESEDLNILLLHNDKPVANHKLRIISLEDYSETVMKTGDNGEAKLKLMSGKWLIAAIIIKKHMATPNIDFDSFWASASFSIPSKK